MARFPKPAHNSYLTLMPWHSTLVKWLCVTLYCKIQLSPHQRTILFFCWNIQLYSLSCKYTFLLVCIVLLPRLKILKLYINITALPYCWKFHFMNMILIFAVMFLDFKQLQDYTNVFCKNKIENLIDVTLIL